LKIRVYHFENYGEEAREKQAGQRFSARILDSLLKTQLDAQKGSEALPPASIFQFRGSPPEDVVRAFKELAPVICVSGFIEDGEDFTADVRVSYIDTDMGITTLINAKYGLSKNSKNWDNVAQFISDEITKQFSVIQKSLPNTR
jgi:hypothetical protein